jgi:hypothetical protein
MSPLRRVWADLRPIVRIILVWIVIILMVVVGLSLGVDKKVIGIAVALFGFLTSAFTGLLTLIAFIPIAGPLIVKIITLPLFWLINGLGNVLGAVAARKGLAREVLNYRVLTLIFLLGIIIGFILGSIV